MFTSLLHGDYVQVQYQATYSIDDTVKEGGEDLIAISFAIIKTACLQYGRRSFRCTSEARKKISKASSSKSVITATSTSDVSPVVVNEREVVAEVSNVHWNVAARIGG